MSVISAVNYFDIPTGNQNLAQTLTNGNDGAGQSIRGINDVSLNTINGSTYPPVVSTPTISQVLSAGNVASSTQTLSGLAELGATNVVLDTINGSDYPPAVSTPTISQVLNAGSDAGSKGILSVGALTGVSSITLGDGSVAPTLGQLGYIYSGSDSGTVNVTSGVSITYSTITGVAPGTYMIFGTLCYTLTSTVILTRVGLSITTGGITIGNNLIITPTSNNTYVNGSGYVNVSTCYSFTGTSTQDFSLVFYIAISVGTAQLSNTNFVFKMVKIA